MSASADADVTSFAFESTYLEESIVEISKDRHWNSI